MSRDIERVPPQGGGSIPAAPSVPEWLVQAADWWIDPDKRRYRTPLKGADRAAARSAGDALAELLKPTVNERALAVWFNALAAAVSKPPEKEAYLGRISAVMVAAGGLPLAALDREALAEALRLFKFWPSAAEVLEVLEARALHLRRLAEALQAIGREQARLPHDVPTRRPPPDGAEMEAVRLLVSSLTQRSGKAPEAPHASPEARESGGSQRPSRSMSPEQLRRAWEEMAGSGDPRAARAAATRLAALDRGAASSQAGSNPEGHLVAPPSMGGRGGNPPVRED